MSSKRIVSNLFRGKKLRSLWGSANRSERARYKSQRGQKTTKKAKPLQLERVFKEMMQFENLPDAPRSISSGNYYLKLFCTPSVRRILNHFFPFILSGENTSNAYRLFGNARIQKALRGYSKENPVKLRSLLASVEAGIKSTKQNSVKISQLAMNPNVLIEKPEEAAFVRHELATRGGMVSVQLVVLKSSIQILLDQLALEARKKKPK